MLRISMAATKGFDHAHFSFLCTVLKQFGFEDFVNACFIFIRLITKRLTKIKFELLFLILINERRYCLVLHSDGWLCEANRTYYVSQQLSMSFDKCSFRLHSSSHWLWGCPCSKISESELNFLCYWFKDSKQQLRPV